MSIISVVSRPEIIIAGICVRATMQTIEELAPKLWEQDFGPRMAEVSTSGQGESYGASWAAGENPDPAQDSFDYWAALPVAKGYIPPQGMALATLPAGLYAYRPVASLDLIGEAYCSIIEGWLPQNPGYRVLMTAPSYELYPADFMQTGAFSLYFPVCEA